GLRAVRRRRPRGVDERQGTDADTEGTGCEKRVRRDVRGAASRRCEWHRQEEGRRGGRQDGHEVAPTASCREVASGRRAVRQARLSMTISRETWGRPRRSGAYDRGGRQRGDGRA